MASNLGDTIVGTAGNDHLNGGADDDTLLGGLGNDQVTAGSGDDIVDGGAGSDRISGDSGNDTLVYKASENTGATDIYDGGSGIDTLRLVLTRAEWLKASVQTDIANYLAFIAANIGNNGQAKNSEFRFTSFDLRVSKLEKLEIVVDGVVLDSRDEAVTAVADSTATNEDSASVGVNLLANDSVPDLVAAVVIATGPTKGTVALTVDLSNVSNPVANAVYTPDAALQSLALGETTTDTFTYTVTDADGDMQTATVTVTITGTNDAPVVEALLGDSAGTATPLLETDAGLTASGTLTVTDIDLTDTVAISIFDVQVMSGSTNGLTTAQLLEFFSAGPASVDGDFGTTNNVSWTFDSQTQAFDYLDQGEVLELQYTVRATDDSGVGNNIGDGVVTIRIEGRNDAPVIQLPPPAGDVIATVQEDTGVVTGQLDAIDPDHSAQLTWNVVGGTTSHAADYEFGIDQFRITRFNDNVNLLFVDNFDAGGPPPQSPNFVGNPTNFPYGGLTGTFTEVGGRAIMDSDLSGPGLGVGTPDDFVAHSALARTNIDPGNLAAGLKPNTPFLVEGTFDLTLPDDRREAYGIRLTDRLQGGTGTPPDQAGDDGLDLVVRMGVDGIVRVQLVEVDFLNDQYNILGGTQFNAAGYEQVKLRLSHSDPVGNSGRITASFDLIDSDGILPTTTTTLSAVGRIFGTETPLDPTDNENWTRAQVVAYAPEESGSSLNGVYGTLTVREDGSYYYNPANNLTAVQALAQGETVFDEFQVQVTDEHGATDLEIVRIEVQGRNDGPAVGAAVSGSGLEGSGTFSVNLLASASDVDHGSTLHIENLDWTDVAGNASPPPLPADFSLSADGNSIIVNPNGLAYDAMAAGATFATHYSYDVVDEHGARVTQTAQIIITGVNDAPVAQTVDLASMLEAGWINIRPEHLLAGVSDIDTPALGLSITSLTLASGSKGLLVPHPDGTWLYNGERDDDTSVVFFYTVWDGQHSASSTATLDLTPVNDAPRPLIPVTGDNLVSNGGFEDGLMPWTPSGNVAVVDPPGRSSEGAFFAGFNSFGGPSGGQLSQVLATEAGKTYVLTFDAGVSGGPWNLTNALRAEALGEAGSVLDVTIDDSTPSVIPSGGSYSPYTFTFTATGSSTTIRFTDLSTDTGLPIGLAGLDLQLDSVKVYEILAKSTDEDVSISDMLPMATDVDSTNLSYTLVEGSATNGTATVGGDGSFTFTPAANYNGSASFKYTVSDDANGISPEYTMAINVIPVNDAPVATADIFGIGDLDAFVTNRAFPEDGQQDTVWINDGTGTFVDSGQALGSSFSFAAELGDLDGDGDLDAFVANGSNNGASTLNVWLNDGSANFANSGQVWFGQSQQDVALGDLDSDGDLDAVTEEQIFFNDGNGFFTGGANFGSSRNAVELGDLDGDGDLDAITASASSVGYNTIHLNNGLGSFTMTNMWQGDARHVTLGDVDGDNDLDAVYAGQNTIWLNNGNGEFTFASALNASYSNHVALADLDGDGDVDAIVASVYGGESVLFNDGAGGFSDSGQQLGGSYTSEMVSVGDVDGDGDQDFVDVTSGSNSLDRIWLNDGAGTFSVGASIGQTHSWDIALGNLDGDGPLSAAQAHILDVLANDSDADGDTLNITHINGLSISESDTVVLASGASVTLTGGVLGYDPTISAFVGLSQGEKSVETLNYTISDGHGGAATTSITLNLVGTNDAPVITQLAHATAATAIQVAENTAGSFLTVTSTDAENQARIYSIGANPDGSYDNGFFTVDPTTGALRFTSPPDFEFADPGNDDLYKVQVTATDTQGGSDAQDYFVQVTDVAEGIPTIIKFENTNNGPLPDPYAGFRWDSNNSPYEPNNNTVDLYGGNPGLFTMPLDNEVGWNAYAGSNSTIVRDSGADFDLVSMALINDNRLGNGANQLLIRGWDDGVMEQQITVNLSNALTTHTMNWTDIDLITVDVTGGDYRGGFGWWGMDNVSVII